MSSALTALTTAYRGSGIPYTDQEVDQAKRAVEQLRATDVFSPQSTRVAGLVPSPFCQAIHHSAKCGPRIIQTFVDHYGSSCLNLDSQCPLHEVVKADALEAAQILAPLYSLKFWGKREVFVIDHGLTALQLAHQPGKEAIASVFENAIVPKAKAFGEFRFDVLREPRRRFPAWEALRSANLELSTAENNRYSAQCGGGPVFKYESEARQAKQKVQEATAFWEQVISSRDDKPASATSTFGASPLFKLELLDKIAEFV